MITHEQYLNYLGKQVEAGLGAGSTLVVAVSGGGDSVALLHGLAALREGLGLELVVGHLDHGLRADSADDAAFVAGLAQQLGLMCVQEWHDVGKQVAAEKGNLENVARRIRYGMLEHLARAASADAIVVAHTADDQAETMLMHLLRGAGLDGLKGMTTFAPSPIVGAHTWEATSETPIFRPLLLVERETLRQWLRAEGHAWREDATNADTTRFRSRLRHEIIPLLAQEQPHLRTFMARTAQLLGADYAWLTEQTEAAWQAAAILYEESVCLERNAFLAQPLALRRRLLRRAFFHVAPSATELSYEQTTAALKVASTGKSGTQATLPGHLFLFVEYDKLWIGPQIDRSDALTLTTSIPLPELGRITAQGLTISLSQVGRQALPNDWRTHPSHIAFLDKATLQRPLQLRCPQANDYWAPLGMKGQQVHLRDWMAKHKVPLAQRDKTPLLVDDKGRILWVVGWQVGETARVRKRSEELVRVVVERRYSCPDKFCPTERISKT